MRLRFAVLVLLIAALPAQAIVIRDDVDDGRYRIGDEAFPALADLPGAGHGVLIAPRWVVTAAHVVAGGSVCALELGGRTRAVKRVIVHPGYRVPPPEMVEAALADGDWSAFWGVLAGSDDIALVELAEAVTDMDPVPLHPGAGQAGGIARLVGRGGTGNGADGQPLDSPQRTVLRHAFNRIESVDGRWLTYRFDRDDTALELEGMGGAGDSGGPVLVEVDGQWHLAALMSWRRSPDADLRAGRYGQEGINLRLAHYDAWLRAQMSVEPAPDRAP